MVDRISWDDNFFLIIDSVARRSPCLKHQIGAVLVLDNQIISTGYNGPARGVTHCKECLRINLHHNELREECPAVHAEVNTVVSAARRGVSIKGATLYSKFFPCSECLSILINAGIEKIIYEVPYSDKLTKRILEQTNIVIIKRVGGL